MKHPCQAQIKAYSSPGWPQLQGAAFGADQPVTGDVAGCVGLQLAAGSCISWPNLGLPGLLRLCQAGTVCPTMSAYEAHSCRVPCRQALGT